jgi:phytoene dehydrogenase-like protein
MYARQLREYRYGPGVFKVDLALDGPIPWANPELAKAGTVHLGGTLDELADGEQSVARGTPSQRPFVLLSQPSLFDDSRAPAGKHVAWAYCHVPNGSRVEMTDVILDQVERFAPGFRDLIIASNAMGPAQLEIYNANYIGGDINGGLQDLRQLWTRPAIRLDPYSTPDRSIFICSSSTPPGGGVHGLCGAFAAKSALRGVLH